MIWEPTWAVHAWLMLPGPPLHNFTGTTTPRSSCDFTPVALLGRLVLHHLTSIARHIPLAAAVSVRVRVGLLCGKGIVAADVILIHVSCIVGVRLAAVAACMAMQGWMCK